MKKQLRQLVGFLAVLATAAAMGQNRGITIANIPFPFTIANRTLPSGRYTITPMGETNLLISDTRNRGTFVQTHSVEGKALSGKGKMVFHRYGAAYFLAEVWTAGDRLGRKVFPSRAEEELTRKRIETEIAVLQISR
jgi:hypothetical protein